MNSILDMSVVRKYTPARKGVAYALQFPRSVRRWASTASQFSANPPVIVNSIPKSGTHMLMQIARGLPDTRYYGSFLAQQPSLSLRKRSDREILFHLSRIVPGEIVGAHLNYSSAVSAAMAAKNIVHFLIIRDPVEIFLSELHYLSEMNRFHRMAKEYKCANQDQRLDICLNGSQKIPDRYPDFEQRILPYSGWLNDPNVCVVRYEDLMDASRQKGEIARLLNHWAGAGGNRSEQDVRLDVAQAAIDPSQSHTISNRNRSEDRKVAVDWLKHNLIRRTRSAIGYEGR